MGDPEQALTRRYFYTRYAFVGWGWLTPAAIFLGTCLALLLKSVAGHEAFRVGVHISLGLAFFCVSGCGYVVLFPYRVALAARKRLHATGEIDAYGRRSFERTRMVNASLMAQAAIGVVVAIWVHL